MNFYSDVSEWQYHLKNSIDWDTIIPLYYPEFPTEDGFTSKEDVIAFVEEMLNATGAWTGEAVWGRSKKLDQQGAGHIENGTTVTGELLGASYQEANDMQLFGLCAPKELGGMSAPVIANLMIFTQLNRACIATATQIGFFTSMIDMLERFASKEDAERLIPQIIRGEISGSMCLTEPGAGSDVGSLKTTAVSNGDGTYKINGSKIFITNGGGGFGFVLARTPDAPEGLNGISLFLVEQYLGEGENRKQNYIVAKNEEKMGLHGSFTCEIVYENSIGKLVGKENHGFRYMLHLMNEARIAVGLQCVGGMEACIHYAKEYAKERVQFGKSLLDLPLFKRNMQDWETERDAFRSLMVDTASFFDIYQKLDMKKRHEEALNESDTKLFKQASKVIRRRTPLVKYYGSETFTLLSQRGIQALGGYGFMEEYDAERLHRDSFAPLLYEGTSQIQALMAMKDLLKYLLRDPGKFFASMINSNPVANVFSGHKKYQKEFLSVHYDFKKNLVKLIIKTLKPDVNYGDPTEVMNFFKAKNWMKEESFEKLMIHAETICQGLSYIETLRVLAKQATKNEERADLFKRYKKLVLPRFKHVFEDWKQA